MHVGLIRYVSCVVRNTLSHSLPSLSLQPPQPKVLNAHDDKVRSMAVIEGGLVVSGSGSNDGYANVWRLLEWFH